MTFPRTAHALREALEALEERGLPYFVNEFEENMTSFEHVELQVETFLENLLK